LASEIHPGVGIMISNLLVKRFFPNVTRRNGIVLEASFWLLSIAPLFCLAYSLCNWLASIRSDVTHLYFDWEKSFPVIPALIIPYLSIGLFVAASFFLCHSLRALRNHACRVLLATLISCTVYLVFPVGFGLDRPTVQGFFGMLFRLLNAVDHPFNETPSSHISVLLLIWPIYAKRLSGWLKSAVDCWFTLIALSVFFTYQHHLIGALAGALVAGICFAAIPFGARVFKPLRRKYFLAERV
jgi:hypothetical protein